MKLPRNGDAKHLIKILETLGYHPTRQVGSHIRLTTSENGQHHITIPNHRPIKVGTLSSILTQLSYHHQLSKKELVELLFNN